MGRRRWATAARVLLVMALAAAAVVAGYAVTAAARRAPAARPAPRNSVGAAALSAAAAPPSRPSAAAQAAPAPNTSTSPASTPAAVAARLRSVVRAAGLGGRLRARVADLASGAVLYDTGGASAAAPASTAKLLTAAALLAVRAPTDRIATTVRRGAGGALVLVGGGDPTLSAAPAGRRSAYPDAARIAGLAAAVRRAHLRPTRIVVDDRLFTGPPVSPSWAPGDVPSDYASAITAAMVDGGRARTGAAVRSAEPDLAAGRALAAALGSPRLPVGRGRAPRSSPLIGEVRSAPLSELIEQMLQLSDNVIAECLGRLVALADHQPASFAGAAAAIRAVLGRLGVDPGAGMRDASGLAASDRLSPAALVGVLRLAARTPRLRDVLAGLPVAAWSGTLADRYVSGSAAAGAGVVRAKTGTLTGVSALAGVVHDRAGSALAFALIADRASSTSAAEAALDRVVAALAGCGCPG
ncbi:D-alanyl-D-alanine carboxypeptidase/D-alanyl-D-alanine-endopeptidase [uncultured Jatrophihabitans sp.]|uniref:D-alanyl-D-alanine carboxypeptidase/D-alanyl-D-alanine endopeptidase n=1 Tax=uncultured Jatrophihabitans sp. TaxID=1610747 RepID=UPI0035CBFEB6